jgi:ribosomal protein L39E
MARYMTKGRKIRLAKKGRQTRWAPFWIIPKIYGANRRVHPGRKTFVKRNWRRSRTNA